MAAYSHHEWQLHDLDLDGQARKDLDVRAEQMLTEATPAAIETAGANAQRVVCQIMQGDPSTTLIDQADATAMLVFGAQGHSGISRWALGSLADYAVQHAPGSVVICR